MHLYLRVLPPGHQARAACESATPADRHHPASSPGTGYRILFSFHESLCSGTIISRCLGAVLRGPCALLRGVCPSRLLRRLGLLSPATVRSFPYTDNPFPEAPSPAKPPPPPPTSMPGSSKYPGISLCSRRKRPRSSRSVRPSTEMPSLGTDPCGPTPEQPSGHPPRRL